MAICHTDGCARGTGESLTIAWRCRGCHADSQFSTMRSGAFLTGRMIDRGLATLHRTIFDPVLSHARMTNGTNSSLRGGMIDPLVGEALMIALAMVMLDVLGDCAPEVVLAGNELIDHPSAQRTRGPVSRRQRMGRILTYYRSAAWPYHSFRVLGQCGFHSTSGSFGRCWRIVARAGVGLRSLAVL